MSITDYDDDELEDDELDETADQGGNELVRKLRKENRLLKKETKRIPELENELGSYRSEKALSTAGLTGLTERQRKVLIREAEGNFDTDHLKAIAVDLGYATQDDDTSQEEEAAHAAMAAAAASGGETKGVALLKPADFQTWDMTRRVDFKKRHPEKFAALKRGESVRV